MKIIDILKKLEYLSYMLMLERILNVRAFFKPYRSGRPLVVANIGNDDSTRGDTHGLIGIAKAISKRLRGDTVVADINFTKDLSNQGIEGHTHDVILSNYFETKRLPDIFLTASLNLNHNMRQYLKKKNIFCMAEYNEQYSSKLLNGDNSLVAHHLTTEILEEEGLRFKQAYPDLPRPLVAVLAMGLSFSKWLAKSLIEKCAPDEQSTIFVCGSRHTQHEAYETFMNELHEARAKAGLNERIVLCGYDFEKNRNTDAYNPYKGLLHQADHILSFASSRSMTSEALATGKTVYLQEGGTSAYDKLIKKGLVKIFDDADNQPFSTSQIVPLNVTDDIAERVIKRYIRHRFGIISSPITGLYNPIV
jgi:mitochondrial fission protein ELM1